MKKILLSLMAAALFILPVIGQADTCLHNDPPLITDDTGDAFGYLDIVSIWFFEKEENPDILYVSMQIADPAEFKFQQTFAFFWKHNEVQYSCGLHMGFDFQEWQKYNAGKYERNDQDLNMDIDGTFDFNTGIITWEIPKEDIGNPQQGDVLTDTWSNAFRRLGFIGRIGFTRVILDNIILQVFGNHMWDYAPERGTYGNNYTVQY